MTNQPLIGSGNLRPDNLLNKVAIVTGAGSGIGFEAARALVWIGARVIIAEIDTKAGIAAASAISKEMGTGKVIFIQTDVGDERGVNNLAVKAIKAFGQVDIVLNNAAVEPLGAVADTPVSSWDLSYRVNLRGPVLLARAFLPGMIKRNSGVFACVSSVGGAYMGPYEVLKRAQVELANTIASECEGTGVAAFTIGPGLVPDTKGAAEGIPKVAGMMGKTVEEFKQMSEVALISVEAAGAGFAAAIALAPNFRGQEISSREALGVAGITSDDAAKTAQSKGFSGEEIQEALTLSRVLRATLEEQLKQWQGLGAFQRQWMIRNFNKRAGLTVEKYISQLTVLEDKLQSGKPDALSELNLPLGQLALFFEHMQGLTKGYVKDAQVREEQLALQRGWQEAAQKLSRLLS